MWHHIKVGTASN